MFCSLLFIQETPVALWSKTAVSGLWDLTKYTRKGFQTNFHFAQQHQFLWHPPHPSSYGSKITFCGPAAQPHSPWNPPQAPSSNSLSVPNSPSIWCAPLSGCIIYSGFLVIEFSVSATESLSQGGSFYEPVSWSIKGTNDTLDDEVSKWYIAAAPVPGP